MSTTTAAHHAGPGVRAAALTLTAAVAIGAFAVSFHALSDFAARNAVPAQLAWIWAVVVDATILAGTLAHVALPDARRPKVIFFGGTAVSIAANAAHAWPAGGAAVAVAIVPPVALAVLVEQCIDLARTRRRAPEPEVTVLAGPSGVGRVLELGEAASAPEAGAVGGTVRPLFPASELTPTVDLTVGWRDGAPRGRGAGRVRAA